MRIAIDLQACQNAGSSHAHHLLELVHALVRQGTGRDLWIAFSNQFPSRIDTLRASFAGLIPPERLVVYDTPAPDGSARMQEMIALIRDNFFAGLGADLVFAPGLFDHAVDTVGAVGAAPRPFMAALSVGTPEAIAAPRGMTPAGAASHARQQASLRCADLVLASSSQLAEALGGTIASDHLATFAAAPEEAAQDTWTALDRLLAQRTVPALPADRPRLAYLCPLAPAGLGERHAGLVEQLGKWYEVHVIVPALPAPAPQCPPGAVLHGLDWFEANAGSFARRLYHVGKGDAAGALLPVLKRHPGVVVLYDFFVGDVIGALERAGQAPHALRDALFHSHGYTGLADLRALGPDEALRKHPANRAVLDCATGVIVRSVGDVALADAAYGAGSAAGWRVLPDCLGPQAQEQAQDAATALRHAEAIEAFTLRSPQAHYQALLRAMRAIGAPKDPRDPALLAAARAIAANQPPARPRRLYVDISAVVRSDLKTGIQRVVRSILLALIRNPPAGYRIEPVYGDGANRRYRHAREFTLAMLGIEGIDAEDTAIEHRPGDVFLGLDLVADITTHNQTLLEDMRNHGVRVCFVVYDILPLLLPNAFPHGTDAGFRDYVDVLTRVADGLVCISRAVADELFEWLGAHAALRPSPLDIGYFHLGADIASSAPSTGLPDNAEQVLGAIAARPTLLMVGTVEPRKGHEQALAAFDLLWARNVDVNLVIVGKPGWMVDSLIKRLEKHPQRNARLFWLSGASDEMLGKLYESCSALLAASVAEGFGLPLIEAAQHSLPIIARSLPVFREVSGGHAFYFEGMEPEALATAIDTWLALFAAGKAPQSARMPWLTWAASAQQLMGPVLGTQPYRSLPGSFS